MCSRAARGVQDALLPSGPNPTEDDRGEMRIICTARFVMRAHSMHSRTRGGFRLLIADGLESLFICNFAARPRSVSEVRAQLCVYKLNVLRCVIIFPGNNSDAVPLQGETQFQSRFRFPGTSLAIGIVRASLLTYRSSKLRR